MTPSIKEPHCEQSFFVAQLLMFCGLWTRLLRPVTLMDEIKMGSWSGFGIAKKKPFKFWV
jgi:hypothetical protein